MEQFEENIKEKKGKRDREKRKKRKRKENNGGGLAASSIFPAFGKPRSRLCSCSKM